MFPRRSNVCRSVAICEASCRPCPVGRSIRARGGRRHRLGCRRRLGARSGPCWRTSRHHLVAARRWATRAGAVQVHGVPSDIDRPDRASQAGYRWLRLPSRTRLRLRPRPASRSPDRAAIVGSGFEGAGAPARPSRPRAPAGRGATPRRARVHRGAEQQQEQTAEPHEHGGHRSPRLRLIGEPHGQHGQHCPTHRESAQNRAGDGGFLGRNERCGDQEQRGEKSGGQRPRDDPADVSPWLLGPRANPT